MVPRVSVLLPVFNAEASLALALRSIARQREQRFECVVVDDGSTDGSLAITREQAERDARFVLVEQGEHRGLVPALNCGLDRCRAAVVARMDADDVMHRLRLELQLAALDADATLAAVGSHVRLFPRSQLKAGLRAYEQWLNAIVSPADVAREAFVECPIAHPTLAIRREALAGMRYRDRGWPEDYDLILRLLGDGQRIGVVPRRLLGWRDGPGRLSRTHPAYRLERFTACRAHFLARGRLATHCRYVLWGYGHTGKALRRALSEHDKQPSAIVELHPGRIGQRIHGAPVIRPQALAELRGLPILVSVAGQPARDEIRAALAEMGFAELDDFVCCA